MCRVCKKRFTDYEVNAREFRRLTSAAAALDAIRAALGVASSENDMELEAEVPCAGCEFSGRSACNFGYPEYDTAAAVGCEMYQPRSVVASNGTVELD